MINLLPPQLKQDYAYARRNISLMKLVTALGLGVIGLAVITVAGYFYLDQTAKSYAARAEATAQELKKQDQALIEKEVEDISGSLKLAVQVLSKEVLFSKLLQRLAVITPENASLAGINIVEFGGGLDITARTIDYNAATQLQINMSDPANNIFAKADIVSITCDSDAALEYPCTAVIRALFVKDNPFLFTNDKEAN